MSKTIKIDDSELFRNNIKQKLDIFFNNSSYSTNLEKGIFNWTLKEATNLKVVKKWDNPYFIKIYLDHLRSIYINLKNNPSLILQIKTKKIKSHELAFMNHQEMYPSKWDELIKAKSIRDMNKSEIQLEASTDTFKCRKCHLNKCTYMQQQCRSADEPMTIFVTCINCGNRWKC